MSVVHAARRLVETHPSHRVVSIYVDLGPERFATAPARASQIRSLLDEAARTVEHDESHDHNEKLALREDLERIEQYLLGREPPFKGSRALAVFCSLRDDLFEVVQLSRPSPGRVAIERTPYIEPLIEAAQDRRWCVALVSRRHARLLSGTPDRLEERRRIDDDVHGQHDRGGWSQSNYERTVEKEADDHLRGVADVSASRSRRSSRRTNANGSETPSTRWHRASGRTAAARVGRRRRSRP